jgi:dihydroflavonol-4-reductase
MKTLVTGANGLLGSNLVRELLRRGHQVRVLVRQGANLTTLTGLDIEFFYGDILEERKLTEACRGCDFVIHSAGRLAGNQTKFSDFAATNIRGTQNIVRAAESAGVIRMVHVSSCCVFGGGRTIGNPGTELSEFTGFRFNSGYINSKYLAQQWVLSEVEKKGFPIVVVNPTIMLGPYDSRPSSGLMILRILRQHFQLCPSGGKNFIDVRDVATATCNALTQGIPGECYLLGSENLTFANFFNKVNRISERNGINLIVPGGLLNCAGLVGNAIKAISSYDIPLNLVNSRQLANISYFSSKKAVRALDLPQRPVDDAIRDSISWFIANKYLEPGMLPGYHVPAVA